MTEVSQPTFRNTKTPGVFRFIQIGDLHLAHRQVSVSLMIKNLETYAVSENRLRDVDMLKITGDVFDHLLQNADDDVHRINRWITKLLFRCARLNVAVRIVEGTPSHDRLQPRFFAEQAQNANIPVDLHYATTLSIEHNERFGITILYVPDKWRPDTNETLQEVRLLMRKQGLDKIDFAIMHGAFEYQLPDIVKEPTHDSDTYLELIRYTIAIGHVHHPTQKERILAAGSFDRICHNEEYPKGGYDVTVRSPDDFRITFLENKGAKRFVTIDCRDMDIKQANVAIRKAIADLPEGSAVRLHCERHSPVVGDLDAIKQHYPQVEWTPPKIEKDDSKANRTTMASILSADMEDFIPIEPATLPGLIEAELDKHAPDEATRQRCRDHLRDLVS